MISPLRGAARRVVDAIAAHLGRSEPGITFVLFALAIVVILGMVAVGIDGARLFDERRRAQNAADHAAVTAAHAMCVRNLSSAAAITAGEASAEENGYNDDRTTNTVTITNPSDDMFIAVIDTAIPAMFSHIIGWNQLDTGATATAECQGGAGDSPGAVYAGGTCPSGKYGIDFPGSDALVVGGVHTNDDVLIGGANGDFTEAGPPNDPFTYVGTINVSGSGNVFQSPTYPQDVGGPSNTLPDPVWTDGWDPTDVDAAMLEDYRQLADANGTTSANDTLFTDKITSITKDGVYYTTHSDGMDIGSISGAVRNVVLVAPNGPIKISVSTAGQVMNAITDAQLDALPNIPTGLNLPREGILILSNKQWSSASGNVEKCDKYTINISGQNASWNGIMWAPGGLIEFAGSDNSAVNGSLVGWAVRLNGQHISIRYNPDLFPGDPDIVLLQ